MYINSRNFPLNHFAPQRNLHPASSFVCVWECIEPCPSDSCPALGEKVLVSFALCTVEWAGGIQAQWSFPVGRRKPAWESGSTWIFWVFLTGGLLPLEKV